VRSLFGLARRPGGGVDRGPVIDARRPRHERALDQALAAAKPDVVECIGAGHGDERFELRGVEDGGVALAVGRVGLLDRVDRQRPREREQVQGPHAGHVQVALATRGDLEAGVDHGLNSLPLLGRQEAVVVVARRA